MAFFGKNHFGCYIEDNTFRMMSKVAGIPFKRLLLSSPVLLT